MEPLDGIAGADAQLGRPFPLPTAALPLPRWVDVVAVADGAAEVAWNLDDSRPGTPGRLALFAGTAPPPDRELPGAGAPRDLGDGLRHRSAPLPEAQEGLRPVHELRWEGAGLHLRLTAQGAWDLQELVRIARSVSG